MGKTVSFFHSWPAAVSIFISVALFCPGCVRDAAETEKKILARDPAFKSVLDKRKALEEELRSLRAAMLQKKQDIENRINTLQYKREQLNKEYASSADKIKRQINPERRQMESDLVMMRYKYKQKKEKLAHISRDIREIVALLDKKDKLAFTQEEIQTWKERLSSLVEKKEVEESEKNKLKDNIEVTTLKIKVLKL
ncbi:MAG: hypothetical protein ABH883_06965 [Candidatus Omnitrophota bacterium]